MTVLIGDREKTDIKREMHFCNVQGVFGEIAYVCAYMHMHAQVHT